ncbi:hypothetical protein GCM10009554_22960 [Kribbella koreensis]|uniref:Uncharacterized protein n=1 Tax=Kribbella koreensis TaxID=57909 RepID=A0ABN1Q076_9ACTN
MTGRRLFRAGLALAGVATLITAALATPTQAATTSATGTTEACWLNAGAITAAGAQTKDPVSGTPPVKRQIYYTPGAYQPGKVRVAAGFVWEPTIEGADIDGFVLEGDSLYGIGFEVAPTGEIDPTYPPRRTRIGGGWSNYTALEISEYEVVKDRVYRSTAYGLRNDGTLFRWNTSDGPWRRTGSAPGFGAVKSMALIGKTATYDMFLANLRGGALYTIKIPLSTPMKPVVTKVRPSGWGGFEKLIADKCGNSGTLLLAIDNDTKSGYTYAMSHANGAATVIQNLGKVNSTFPDAVNFRWANIPRGDPLNGG